MNSSDLSEAFFLLLFFGNGDEEKQFALHLFHLKIKKSNHSPGILSGKTKKIQLHGLQLNLNFIIVFRAFEKDFLALRLKGF